MRMNEICTVFQYTSFTLYSENVFFDFFPLSLAWVYHFYNQNTESIDNYPIITSFSFIKINNNNILHNKNIKDIIQSNKHTSSSPFLFFSISPIIPQIHSIPIQTHSLKDLPPRYFSSQSPFFDWPTLWTKNQNRILLFSQNFFQNMKWLDSSSL